MKQKILITDQADVYYYDKKTKVANKLEPLPTDQEIIMPNSIFDFTTLGLPQEIHDLIQYYLVYCSIKAKNFDAAVFYTLESNRSNPSPGWVRKRIYSELICSEEDAFIHSKTLQENRILANFCLLSGIFDMYVNEPMKFNDIYPYIIHMQPSHREEFCPPWAFVDFQEVMLNYEKSSTTEFEFDDCQLMTTGPNFGDIALLQTWYCADGMYDLLKLCRPVILFHLECTVDHFDGEQLDLKQLVTEENCDECAKDKDWNLFSLLTKLAFGKDSEIFFRIDDSDCFTLVDNK
jgi:hypothetical protein